MASSPKQVPSSQAPELCWFLGEGHRLTHPGMGEDLALVPKAPEEGACGPGPWGIRDPRGWTKDARAPGTAQPWRPREDQRRGWGRRSGHSQGRQQSPPRALLPRDPEGDCFLRTLCSGCESWRKQSTLANLQLPV